MAWEFKRNVEESLIEELKKSDLWNEKLKSDCKSGDVFLAIRDGNICFYYKGGRLFKFDKSGFSTHVKYASVINTDNQSISIYEAQLKNMRFIRNFADGYARIKENCQNYSGIEAEGVSNLFQTSSYLQDKSTVLLDIEIAFKNDGKSRDRIDILLYDKNSQTLRFVEAKHFSNSELWSMTTPPVVEQIKRYEDQISQYRNNLIKEYGNYIGGLNQIFDKQYKPPIVIEPKVSLLIFGFDKAQQQDERFKNLILKNSEYENISIYCKGDPKMDLQAESIWNAK